MNWFLGIDGGGTKCRAVIINEQGDILANGLSGSANPVQGQAEAMRSVLDAATQALQAAGNPVGLADLHAGVALAGLNIPVHRQAFENWAHPFKTIALTTDLHAACLGAHGGSDGAVIISGTGSCGYRSINGVSHTMGGYGFPHGDQGSGAWIGLKAVEATLLDIDGLIDCPQLRTAVETFIDGSQTQSVEAYFIGQGARVYAALAPIVFDLAQSKQCATAQRIIDDATQYIVSMARQLVAGTELPLSLIGSVNHRLSVGFPSDIQAHLCPAMMPPEMGAIEWAKRCLLHRGEL